MVDKLELSSEEIAKVKAGETAAKSLLNGRTWRDWMAVAEALEVGRRLSQTATGAESREGSTYCTAFSEWLDEKGHENLRRVSAPHMSYLDKCWQAREAIEAWRATLVEDQRMQWNHPRTVWEHYERNNIVPETQTDEDLVDEAMADSTNNESQSFTEETEEEINIRRTRRQTSAATAEFVEWITGYPDEIPTIITWLQEMDVDEVITALREYVGTYVSEDA